MEKIIAILFFLSVAVTDPMEDYSPDLRYDITKPMVFAIQEMMQAANPHILANSLTKRILKLQPLGTHSYIVDSQNITFSKFISDEEIANIIYVQYIACEIRKSLIITLPIGNENETMIIEGRVLFPIARNHTPECQLLFNFTFHDGRFEFVYNFAALNERFIFYSNFTISTEVMECKSTYNLTSIWNDISQAVHETMKNRMEPIIKSIFQSVSDHCRNFIRFDETSQKYYAYFKLDRNIDAFPWKHDYNELVIKNFHNILRFDVQPEDDGSSQYLIIMNGLTIHRNITSLESQSHNVESVLLFKSMSKNANLNDLRLMLYYFYSQDAANHIAVSREIITQFEKNIKDGIKQTTEKIPYNYIDADAKLPKCILEIIQRLDKKTLDKLFLYPEDTLRIDSISAVVKFSKIEVNGFHDLKPISCFLPEFSEIGCINYEQLNAQVEFSYNVKETRINKFSIIGNVSLGNAAIHIFLDRYPNLTKQIFAISINDTFNNSNALITMDSTNYNRLTRDDRISIGTGIFETLVKMIKNHVLKTIKHILTPMLEICEKWQVNGTELQPSHHNKRENFFGSISDHWDNEVKSIDMVLNGSWNYNFINITQVHGGFIVNNLRIENIVANVRQFENGLKEAVSSNFNIKYLFLTINHTGKDVKVEISGYSVNHMLFPSKSNITLSSQNETNILENIKMTIASFIEQLIYSNDQKYPEMFRKLAVNAMEEARQKYPRTERDLSSIFIQNFVHKLLICREDVLGDFEQHINEAARIWFNRNELIVLFSDLKIDKFLASINFGTFNVKEICDNSYYVVEEINGNNTTILIEGYSVKITDSIKHTYTISFSIKFSEIKFSYIRYNRTLSLMEINNENIQVQLTAVDGPNLSEIEQEVVKKFLAEYSRKHLEDYFIVELSKERFCGVSEVIARREKFTIAMNLGKHFYAINNTVEYTTRRFLMYHIQIYRLLNLKTVSLEHADTFTKFKFTVKNLTASILWIHYLGGLIPKIPVLKKMDVQIDEIELVGRVNQNWGKLRFFDASKLKFAVQQNSQTNEMLENTLGPVVLESIQNSITAEYDKERSKKWRFRRPIY